MSKLTWDQTGERRFETGVDHGVLFIPNVNGVYNNGVAWNGLTTVTESPSGAESNPQYADNIKYLDLISAEEFGATIEAFTYPDEFAQFDGVVNPHPGVSVGQQGRKFFGLSYRSKVGNDVDGDLGYKIHLVYGCHAAPSEKAYGTVNDSPEAITFSWEITTTPVPVTGLKPTAILTIDSTKVTAANLAALEDALYGTAATSPRLPLPDEVIGMFAGAAPTQVTPTAPTYNAATHEITIPTITGVNYFRTDTDAALADGSVVTLVVGEAVVIAAVAEPGYVFPANVDTDWGFTY